MGPLLIGGHCHKTQREPAKCVYHRVHIFTRDETGLVYLLTQLERTLQLYWGW
jgi:hypothetical protein